LPQWCIVVRPECFSELERSQKEELIYAVWDKKPLSPAQREVVILALHDKDPGIREYAVLNGAIFLGDDEKFAVLSKSMFDTNQDVACRASFVFWTTCLVKNPEMVDIGFHSPEDTRAQRERFIDHLKKMQDRTKEQK
jgi:hypothetical protein